MPRTIKLEMVDGQTIEMDTSMASLLRVEEAFGCPWREAFRDMGEDPERIAKMAAALSGEEEAYVLENFDLSNVNTFGDKIADMLGIDPEDFEGMGDTGKRGRGTRSGGVPGKPKPRPRKKAAKKPTRKRKPGAQG